MLIQMLPSCLSILVSVSLSKVKMPLLYPNGRVVQHRKVLVLKALMTFVPPVHHAFYKHLKIDNVDDEDDSAGI